jgi:hypothetical protein
VAGGYITSMSQKHQAMVNVEPDGPQTVCKDGVLFWRRFHNHTWEPIVSATQEPIRCNPERN